MKIDEALERIKAALTMTEVDVVDIEKVRPILEELYASAVLQGQLQLQEDLRHLLGIVKE